MTIRYRLTLPDGSTEVMEDPDVIDVGVQGGLVIYQRHALKGAYAPGQWVSIILIPDDDPADPFTAATRQGGLGA